ncbi:hypothetical protein NQ318_022910 [Aromia moschata]|uniref:Uncharacterized protein n=1 Tax=Aromia moschata TaxID=1265417 RepID=A0AAV8YE97_9CUCU|nr:hypothetical protein NQ318_022910 [Aromia moschata]
MGIPMGPIALVADLEAKEVEDLKAVAAAEVLKVVEVDLKVEIEVLEVVMVAAAAVAEVDSEVEAKVTHKGAAYTNHNGTIKPYVLLKKISMYPTLLLQIVHHMKLTNIEDQKKLQLTAPPLTQFKTLTKPVFPIM